MEIESNWLNLTSRKGLSKLTSVLGNHMEQEQRVICGKVRYF